MKTTIKKIDDVYVVCVEGRLDFENQLPFRDNLHRILESESKVNQDSTSKIVFDLEKLDFVGSSGIKSFIQTLKEVSSRNDTSARYANVRSEFQKIIRAFDEEIDFDFYESIDQARSSIDH